MITQEPTLASHLAKTQQDQRAYVHLQDGSFGKIQQEDLARPIICEMEQEDLARPYIGKIQQEYLSGTCSARQTIVWKDRAIWSFR